MCGQVGNVPLGSSPLFLLLLSNVLSPIGPLINTSFQGERYFDPESQAALHWILTDWTNVQRSTVGQFEQHKDEAQEESVVFSRSPT